MRKLWVTTLGWVLTLAGIAALVLPGPGLLLLLAGLVVLSQEYEWARVRVEPVKRRAFETSAAGVSTWPRILLSVLGGLALVGAGVAWWLNPVIGDVWIFGPRLPFGGWPTGVTLILSGLVVLALVVYSYRRFRPATAEDTARPRSVES